MKDNELFGDLSEIDLDELIKQDVTLLKICASRTDLPSIVYARLACHRDENVRLAVARNEATPIDILAVLADDESNHVRCAIASNTSTPSDVLNRIVENGRVGVDDAVKNPSTPLVSILSRMLSSIPEREKAALVLNDRFDKLLQYAAEIDRNSKELDLSSDDFSKDSGADGWS